MAQPDADLVLEQPAQSEEATVTKKKVVTNPRCHAHKKSGEQCRNQSLNGMTVCRFHGGATGSSRDAARRRILHAADPAAAVVIEIATDKRAPRPVRLAAARDILDRADLSGRSVLSVEFDLDPDLMAMVMEARTGAVSTPSGRPALHGAVVDGELMTDVIDAEIADDEDPDSYGYLDLDLPEVEDA